MPCAMPVLPCPPGKSGEGRPEGARSLHQPGSFSPSLLDRLGQQHQVGQHAAQKIELPARGAAAERRRRSGRGSCRTRRGPAVRRCRGARVRRPGGLRAVAATARSRTLQGAGVALDCRSDAASGEGERGRPVEEVAALAAVGAAGGGDASQSWARCQEPSRRGPLDVQQRDPGGAVGEGLRAPARTSRQGARRRVASRSAIASAAVRRLPLLTVVPSVSARPARRRERDAGRRAPRTCRCPRPGCGARAAASRGPCPGRAVLGERSSSR